MARTLPPTTRTTMQEQPSASGAPSAPPFATVMLCPSEDDQEKAARARSASLSIRGGKAQEATGPRREYPEIPAGIFSVRRHLRDTNMGIIKPPGACRT